MDQTQVIIYLAIGVNGVLLSCLAFFLSRLINKMDEMSHNISKIYTRLAVFEEIKKDVAENKRDLGFVSERQHFIFNKLAYIKSVLSMNDLEKSSNGEWKLPPREKK